MYIQNLIYVLPILVFSFSLHEAMHSLAAYKMGDYTQKENGRLTLNPFKHIDPVGFIMLITLGFGWAKPVMCDPSNFRDYKKGMFITAIAGPLSNLFLAIIAIFLQIVTANYGIFGLELQQFLMYSWMINISLFMFNMLPLPPLDGSKLLIMIMNRESYEAYQSKTILSFLILMMIIATDMFEKLINFVYLNIADFILMLLG